MVAISQPTSAGRSTASARRWMTPKNREVDRLRLMEVPGELADRLGVTNNSARRPDERHFGCKS
jgi:hypothetical protein